MGNNLLGWQAPRIYYPEHISPLSTTSSTATGHYRTSPLMSLNPLAPAFLPHHQSSSDPRASLNHSNTMNLPLAQLIRGMPSQTIPSINQHIADNTLLLPLLQPKPDVAANQSTPGSSAPLPSSLQHQANCLQAINKTIKQFNQHLKAEQLDRQTLQLILLQLQNDFALLRYLLFSPVDTTLNKDIKVKDAATSPLLIPHVNPNPNPNPNPTSSAFLFPGPGEPKLHRSTPVGPVGAPTTKTNNTTNADFKPTTNSQEAPSTTMQNLTTRICKLEQLFANEISNYTSITAGIHSQYFYLYDKIRQLEPGNSDAII